MKLIAVFSLALCLALGQVNADCPKDCPDTEDVVWALYKSCSVYRNQCYFDKANCDRNPPLTIVTKEACQPHCTDLCMQVIDPVSGTYNGQVYYFNNQCRKDMFSCQTGISRSTPLQVKL
ncbi:hypothetical protein KR222_005754 [Zaprionus bogoriensis]|nr:hypothetical protein KR222_005754 [Zaprionus bogoriensis]